MQLSTSHGPAAGGNLTRGPDQDRIDFLAQARNRALEPLWLNASAATTSDFLPPSPPPPAKVSLPAQQCSIRRRLQHAVKCLIFLLINERSVGTVTHFQGRWSPKQGASSYTCSFECMKQCERKPGALLMGRAAASFPLLRSRCRGTHMVEACAQADRKRALSWFMASDSSAAPLWHAEKIVFLNDVFFCARDVIRLLHHEDADMACGMDFDRTRLEDTPWKVGPSPQSGRRLSQHPRWMWHQHAAPPLIADLVC